MPRFAMQLCNWCRGFCLQLQSEVEKPLLTFRADNFKKDMKKYDHHIADLRKQLVSRYAAVEKVQSAWMFCLNPCEK